MTSSKHACPTLKRWLVQVFTSYGHAVCLAECNGRNAEAAKKKARAVMTKQGKAAWLYTYVPIDRKNQSGNE